MRIDVAFTPGEPEDASVAIVIDVLRATTTIAYALAQGYQRVLACGEIDQARVLAELNVSAPPAPSPSPAPRSPGR